jgi:hypothetical protein
MMRDDEAAAAALAGHPRPTSTWSKTYRLRDVSAWVVAVTWKV